MRTRAELQELLERRIRESGLSVGEFAVLVLRRDPRTVRRWLSGERAIAQVVEDFLEEPTEAPWP